MPHSQAAPTESRRHAARMVFPTDLSTCSVHNPPGLPRPKSQKGLTGLGKHADQMKRVHPHKVIHIGRGCYIVQQTLFRQLVAVGFASGVRVAVDKWGAAGNAALVCSSPHDQVYQPRTPMPTGKRQPETAVPEPLTPEHAPPTSGIDPQRVEDAPQTLALRS